MAFTQQFPQLCAPLHIGSVTLRNRMCSAPMGFPDLTEDGCLTEGAIAFYENRARGGAAVVTVSEACVDYRNGKSHGRLINLQNPGVLAGLTNAARAIRRHGALASIELNHAGMLSDFDVLASERRQDGDVHYGPSDTVLPSGTRVLAMTEAQLREAVLRFAEGAALVKRAGFDMILVHAGHGWLLHQFLSPLTNRRTDAYGGSFENRCRLTLEVLDAIRARVGADFPIELRFSAMEAEEGGITLQDACRFAALVQDRVDILHVSAGSEPDFLITHPSMFAQPGCNVRYAAEIRKHVRIPVAAIGALNEPEQMEEILRSGQADLVCMARALLADPELPRKVEANRTDEILRCMRCFTCHAERMLTQTRICAINPEIGREYEAKFDARPTAPKRVLVIGGGSAGMQAAVTAAQRGHSVTLWEKTDVLGGKLVCETPMPFKAAFPRYVQTMARRMALAGVAVQLNTEATPELVRAFAPDVLLIAIGAEPVIPPIPGHDRAHVLPVTELHLAPEAVGRQVVIIGGGLAGCECAVYLRQQGRSVTLFEQRDAVAPDANPRHRPALLRELENGIAVHTAVRATEITENAVCCQLADGREQRFPADTVILACGLRAKTAEADAFRGLAPRVEIIGDCDRPGMLRGATFRAHHAALDI